MTLVLASDDDLESAKAFVLQNFSGLESLKANNLTLGFSVSRNEKVAEIGAKILANRHIFHLVDFAVKQTTLDEVKMLF